MKMTEEAKRMKMLSVLSSLAYSMRNSRSFNMKEQLRALRTNNTTATALVDLGLAESRRKGKVVTWRWVGGPVDDEMCQGVIDWLAEYRQKRPQKSEPEQPVELVQPDDKDQRIIEMLAELHAKIDLVADHLGLDMSSASPQKSFALVKG